MLSSAVFLMRELLLTWRPGAPRLRILFSERRSWRPQLERSFRLTPHRIAFAELSGANLLDADLVVPLTMPDLLVLSRARQTAQPTAPSLLIPIPRPDVIGLLHNKRDFNHGMLRHDYARLVPSLSAPHTFPYVVKKAVDQWGAHSHVVHSRADETRYAQELGSDEYFTQALVPGHREYATHLLMRDGVLLAHLNVEYTFPGMQSIKGQDRESSRALVACPFLDEFVHLLRAIGFNGLCCVNYKVQHNRPMILEINPRFGGSLAPYFFSFLRYLA